MHRIRKAFHKLRPKGARGSRRGSRRLLIESLEVRQVLDAAPFYIYDHTFLDTAQTEKAFDPDEIYIALWGQDYTAEANYYYFDEHGNPTATGTSGTVPTFKLSQLDFDTEKQAHVINLPMELGGITNGIQSARMYFAMGDNAATGLAPTINGDGSVNAPKTNSPFYFDYIEFSLNAPGESTGNLNIDTTNVDGFGLPIQLNVDPVDGSLPNGVGAATNRAAILSAFDTFAHGTDYADLVLGEAGEYGSFRILSPGHQLEQQAVGTSFINTQTILQEFINSTQKTLLVNGSLAGFPDPADGDFLIRIGEEQMTVKKVADNGNNFYTWTVERGTNAQSHKQGKYVHLDQLISDSQTYLASATQNGFPTTYPFNILVDDEIMHVTGLLGENTAAPIWQVERGYGGSTKATHADNAEIYYYDVAADPLNYYFNHTIDEFFKYYSEDGHELTLTNAENSIVYTGTVVPVNTDAPDVDYTTYVMRFTSEDDKQDDHVVWYDVYYPFFNDNRYFWADETYPQPTLTVSEMPPWLSDANVASMGPSQMAFLNNGVFADQKWRPNNADLYYYATTEQAKVLADFENQIVAAINRGVALEDPSTWETPPYYDASGAVWNNYAEFLHKDTVSIDGLNYGFAFDDQAGQASDIAVSSFDSVSITLGAWAAETGPGPGPGPDPDPPVPSGLSMRAFMASQLAHDPPVHSPLPSPSPAPLPEAAPLAATDAALLAALEDDADEPLDLLDDDSGDTADEDDVEVAVTAPVAVVAPPVFSMRGMLSSSLGR